MWVTYVVSTLLLAILVFCVPNSFAKEDGLNFDNANKYPFLVSVRVDGVHRCTGTIIAPSWILTAATCVGKSRLHQISVQYGVEQLSRNKKNNVALIQNRVTYQLWSDSHPHVGDLTLLHLQVPLTYNDNVSPVSLSGSEIDLAGEHTVLVGWTLNSTENSVPDEQTINLMAEECPEQLKLSEDSVENICTKYDGAEKIYPFFPFGGPLIYDGVQVGVASWQPGTDISALPNVYINISYYTEWISIMLDEYGGY